MIFSENKKPELSVFQNLMRKTDDYLNDDAHKRESYYIGRGGKLLESDVYEAVTNCAVGTEFENTIQLISGASFPDIIANDFYGIEVKSTEKDHWTSTGSSILESTRNVNVEKIYLTFGKLGSPVRFLSRPYEECMSEIAVTHYPRYKIDMRLKKGETIFDKIGISYDELRRLENPVIPVSRYYRSLLHEGESLWWASDNIEDELGTSPVVRLWTSLSHEEKEAYIVKGYILFPEIIDATNNKKYNRYALWLATQQGIVNTNIRDSFSAGGQVVMKQDNGIMVRMPAVFGRIKKYKSLIIDTLNESKEEILMEYWHSTKIKPDRLSQWLNLVSSYADSSVGYDVAMSVLKEIFG